LRPIARQAPPTHRIRQYVELFRGTLDGASVHPREVVKLALAKNAAAVVLCHPHPSGIAEPCQADELITLRLKDTLALVDIRVLDHVLGGNSFVTIAGEITGIAHFHGELNL
jgi:DNA repair protein RadC